MSASEQEAEIDAFSLLGRRRVDLTVLVSTLNIIVLLHLGRN